MSQVMDVALLLAHAPRCCIAGRGRRTRVARIRSRRGRLRCRQREHRRTHAQLVGRRPRREHLDGGEGAIWRWLGLGENRTRGHSTRGVRGLLALPGTSSPRRAHRGTHAASRRTTGSAAQNRMASGTVSKACGLGLAWKMGAATRRIRDRTRLRPCLRRVVDSSPRAPLARTQGCCRWLPLDSGVGNWWRAGLENRRFATNHRCHADVLVLRGHSGDVVDAYQVRRLWIVASARVPRWRLHASTGTH